MRGAEHRACRSWRPAFQAVRITSGGERSGPVRRAGGWGCDGRGAEYRACRSGDRRSRPVFPSAPPVRASFCSSSRRRASASARRSVRLSWSNSLIFSRAASMGLPHGFPGFVTDGAPQFPQHLTGPSRSGISKWNSSRVRAVSAADPDASLPLAEGGRQSYGCPVADDLDRDLLLRVEVGHRAHHVPGVLRRVAGDAGDDVTHLETGGGGGTVFGPPARPASRRPSGRRRTGAVLR